MSDTRETPHIGYLTHRELEECLRQAEMARADYIADALHKFFNRLRHGFSRPARAATVLGERRGEPLEAETRLELG